MVLVVEDGTGLETANSYADEAEADAYFVDRPSQDATWTTKTSDEKDEALILATQYLDATYGGSWIGQKGSGEQALDWPRTAAVTQECFTLPSDEIPQELKNATFEAAFRSVPVGSDTLLPDLLNPGNIESEFNKVGPIENRISYSGAGASQIKKYRVIDGMLRRIIFSQNQVVRG